MHLFRRKNRGMTIYEALISLAIIALAVSMAMSMISFTAKSSAYSYALFMATSEMSDLLECYKENPATFDLTLGFYGKPYEKDSSDTIVTVRTFEEQNYKIVLTTTEETFSGTAYYNDGAVLFSYDYPHRK